MGKYEPNFMLIQLNTKETGVLRTVGEREFVGTVKLLNGADAADNEWIAKQLMLICEQYYTRVNEYLCEKRGTDNEKI